MNNINLVQSRDVMVTKETPRDIAASIQVLFLEILYFSERYFRPWPRVFTPPPFLATTLSETCPGHAWTHTARTSRRWSGGCERSTVKRYIEGRSMFEIQIKVIQSIISAVGSIILSFSCEHTVGLDGAVWMVETIGFFWWGCISPMAEIRRNIRKTSRTEKGHTRIPRKSFPFWSNWTPK